MAALNQHPRLYLPHSAQEMLKAQPAKGAATAVHREMLALAKAFLASGITPLSPTMHNAHLIRAREMQKRIVTLLAAWTKTGQNRYREAVINHLRIMAAWECWSWITWRTGNFSPEAIFDLSYGENSATLAIAYDWLYRTLSKDEKALIVGMARKWPLASWQKRMKDGAPWWLDKKDSNWNSVCAGGLGMLCLAMHEDLPEAGKVLERLDKSIMSFYGLLRDSGGAWPEGIGYWNYGMRYGFMYLLSYENTTGKKHPALAIPQVRDTLSFPIQFCPNGVPCSFGDCNGWSPMPFHYLVAKRLGADSVCGELSRILENSPEALLLGQECWPDIAEWCLVYNAPAKAKQRKASPVAKLYKGLDWAVFADSSIAPTRAITVRGGTTNVPHGHVDLLSFNCAVNGQSMISSLTPCEYLDTTFSERRNDIFEMRPDAKNTIFISGVGVAAGSSCDKTEMVKTRNAVGVRIEASSAFGKSFDGGAGFAGRMVLFVRNKYFLILDHMELAHPGRLESRMHTFAKVKAGKDNCLLGCNGEYLSLGYASTEPAMLVQAAGAPTNPSAKTATMLRWITTGLHCAPLFATVLNPGRERLAVTVQAGKGEFIVVVDGKHGRDVFRLGKKLKLKK